MNFEKTIKSLFRKPKATITAAAKWRWRSLREHAEHGLRASVLFVMKKARIQAPDFQFMDRIGHLIVEPECYLKEHWLQFKKWPRALMLAPRGHVANRTLVKYWRKYFYLIESPYLVHLLRPLRSHVEVGFDTGRYATVINETATAPGIQAAWQDRPPLLKLSGQDDRRGRKALRKLGIPDNGWFVCVHAREGGYSPTDEQYHSFRNSNIESYVPAIEYLVAQGGTCVRMGDATMRPAPAIKGLIDYARSPEKADWLDLFLAARCRFFLGSDSGAPAMASVFGVPTACVNKAPLSGCLPWGARDLGIPKLYKAQTTGRILSFAEIFSSPSSNYRYAAQYRESGIELVDNTPDEILDLAKEQFLKTGGAYKEDPVDEGLQRRFKALLQPGHYSYGSASRIGNAFLRKHENLL